MKDIYEYLYNSYDKGNAILPDINIEEADKLLNHEDEFVRSAFAKALVNDAPDKDAMRLLIKLCTDKDWCVRIEAIDSLSEFPYKESFDTLANVCIESDEMIRSYAIYGLCIVSKKLGGYYQDAAISRVQSIERSEQSEFVQVNIYSGLYILGIKSYLQPLIALISSEDYHIKCAVFRSLADIYSPENRDILIQVLEQTNENEMPVAMKEAYCELKQIVLANCDADRSIADDI